LLLPSHDPGGLRPRVRRGDGGRTAGGGVPGGGGARNRRPRRDRGAGDARASPRARDGDGERVDERPTTQRAGRPRAAAGRGLRSRSRGAGLDRGPAVVIAYSTRRFSFSAGHRYVVDDWSPAENERVFGRLTVPHGHNYALDVTVRGPIDPETGMVIDLGE